MDERVLRMLATVFCGAAYGVGRDGRAGERSRRRLTRIADTARVLEAER